MRKFPAVKVRNAQRGLRFDILAFQEFAERALHLCLKGPSRSPLARLPQVDVLLVSDRRIAALHRKFMKIAGPTDVITFQHGEIFISVETAQRNARHFHSTIENEIKLYLVHGLLHLSGFDDKTAAKARVMARRQTQIIQAAAV